MKCVKSTKFLFIILTLISCTGKVDKHIKPGESTVTEAIELYGTPDHIRVSSFSKDIEVFMWKEHGLQIDKKLVVASFRLPEDEEKYLQYWRNKYKAEKSTFEPVRSPASENIWQLKFPNKGISVIYDKRLSVVTKVIKHAKTN